MTEDSAHVNVDADDTVQIEGQDRNFLHSVSDLYLKSSNNSLFYLINLLIAYFHLT